MVLFGLALGWWMIGAAALLIGVALYISDKHDFGKIDGMHFSAATNDENKLGALGVMVCVGAAAALYYFGRQLL